MLEKDKENIIIIILYRSIRESIMLVHIPRKKIEKIPLEKIMLTKTTITMKTKKQHKPP